MFTPSYQKNIGLLAVTEFFGFFGITTFWILFLTQHGMTLWQAGLLESIFHATSFLSEVPSGLLADRFSYKTNLYISRLCGIVSAVLMLVGNGSFWLYALAMVVSAWSYNFDSGTSAAMLFESAKEAGKEHKFLSYSSLISGVGEATRTLGMVVAGFFVHGLLDVTYLIQIACSLVVMLAIWQMKEPTVKKTAEENPTLAELVRMVIHSFKTNPALLRWLLISEFLSVLMCMFYFYYQNEIDSLPSWQISLVMLISSAVNIAAVWLASRIGEKWSAKGLMSFLVVAIGGLYLLAYLQVPVVYMVIYILTEGLYALFQPIYGNDLQQQFDSSVRATMLSVTSMFFSLSMIVIFPVTGWLIDSFGFATTFVLLGVILLMTSFIRRFWKTLDKLG